MISLDQALAAYRDNLPRLESETISLTSACQRVLAEPTHAAIDLPRFDQSAMDGYALKAEESDQPLTVSGVAACGEPAPSLQAGTACRIYTGAPIPAGADTVVPQENVQVEAERMTCTQTPETGAHIRRHGEELSVGHPLIDSGIRLNPGSVAALAMAGLSRVSVHRSPRIKVLVTGDEVRPPGGQLDAHQIPDANGPLIKLYLAAWGYSQVEVEYIGDREELVRKKLEQALATSDLVISTGGASVGDRDFLPVVSRDLGMQQVFWKVAQKPGKPLLFAVKDRSALLALPGNPGAVLVGMLVHARTALACLEGQADPLPRWRSGRLLHDHKPDRRERLLRMRVETDGAGGNGLALLPRQASHMLSNLAQANALVRLPADTEISAGDIVRWLPLTGGQ